MKKVILIFVLTFMVVSISNAQWKINENFESSLNIPEGWLVKNNAIFPIDTTANWAVHDTGSALTGIAKPTTSKAHSGTRACQVTWVTGVDTNTGAYLISDSWLITKQITIGANDRIIFWATGGSPSWVDSMQVWVSLIDSDPNNFTEYIGSIIWLNGVTYGNWTQYNFPIGKYAGLQAYIGFRYNMNVSVMGYVVQIDDIQVGDPTAVTPIGTNIPDKFDLSQNYPNPFNPKTNIKFDIAKATNVKLIIYNALGQAVKTLVNEYKPAGSYVADFDASGLTSGTYFYTLTTNEFTQTKKMVVVK